jgi:hypothetical protein
MIRGLFFGRRITSSPALAGLNPAIRAFIVSEVLFWSAWNIIIPIFAVFVVAEIPGATVAQAAYGFTAYLLVRMVVELLVSHKINHLSNAQRAILDMVGMLVISLAYLGLVIQPSLDMIYVFYGLCGIGMGIAAPAKNSLFSRSMEKGTESAIWGVYDVAILSGMAIATSVGGYLAGEYGFRVILLIASAVNILGALPYLFFIRHWRKNRHRLVGVAE